jgi:1-acyl-sn-glycerol-3-phosphate acyltransferase
MIPARKRPRFARWFARRCRARLARDFEAVRVEGLDRLRRALAEGPVLVVSNHASWWDPMIAIVLGTLALDCDGYAMMDARNLRRLPFLGLVGGFGVTRGEADRAALDYASALLDRTGRLVWVFPQGEERSVTQRPLGFRHGAAVVAAAVPGARVVPVGLRYEAGRSPRATAYVSIGPGRAPRSEVEAERAAQETDVTDVLDRLDAHLCGRAATTFETLVPGRTRRLEALAEAALARLTRRALR